jgi:pullulanase
LGGNGGLGGADAGRGDSQFDSGAGSGGSPTGTAGSGAAGAGGGGAGTGGASGSAGTGGTDGMPDGSAPDGSAPDGGGPGTDVPITPLDTLGAIYTPASTTFRIWSPDSSTVSVTIEGTSHPMSVTVLPGYTDVYQTVVMGDQKGKTYQFRINTVAVRDPYAQMMSGGASQTQGVVINDAAVMPSDGSWAPRPPLVNREDSVLYELHVRGYTHAESSGVDAAKRGKYLGLVQTGTTFTSGATTVKTGIDHLKELGITHVHLMPTYDMNSTQPNWGYDPINYNVPEEQFSQLTAPEDRVREFKDMVNEFHKNGIRVILDVVYNHTYAKTVFQSITPKYYTATDYSGVGNSLDDSQPMVSRMIRDSLEHWVRNYNVDGFRFDLMGVFHHPNVRAWGTYLNSTYPAHNLVLYGEPWMGGVIPPSEADFVRYGTVPSLEDGHIGVFNGAFRDVVKGSTRGTDFGYMGGTGNAASIVTGMRGSPLATKSTDVLSNLWDPAFTYDPEQTINYVSAHDDLNLFDKIYCAGVADGPSGRAGQMDKVAVGIVLTSQGIPFMTEGDEFLRSKAMKGDCTTAMNSFNASDTVNDIDWSYKVTNGSIFKFYREAIAVRKSTAALRLTTWDAVSKQMSTRVSGSVVVGSIASDATAPTNYDTVVVYNPGSASYDSTLTAGTWTKVLDASGAVNATDTTCAGMSVTLFKKN